MHPAPFRSALGLAAAALALFSCQAQRAAGPLDGRVYAVQLVDPSGQAQPDALVFDAGTFESVACRPFGFSAADYSAETASGGQRFEASARCEAGTTRWRGSAGEERVEGTMEMTDAKGESSLFRFSGFRAKGPLDGKSFDVMLVQGSGSGDPDHLIFAGGGFESTACRPYGFHLTSYEVEPEGDALRFKAVSRNCDGLENRWVGRVRGETVEGDMQQAKPDGTVVASFTFRSPAKGGA